MSSDRDESNFDTRGLASQAARQLLPRLLPRLLPILIGLAMIGFMMVKGCQRGPFGRQQVVAMNPQQEQNLGFQAYQEVLAKSRVLTKGPQVDFVMGVVERLVKATQRPEFLDQIGVAAQKLDWQVNVVVSPEKNAFCLPGGKIVVYTGILELTGNSDAMLATVLGHEISHALAHHGAERMAQEQMVEVGLGAANGSLGDMDPNQRQHVLSVLNAGAKFGILGYSRKHESEADHMGLLLMAAAGYDPRESVKFWERMTKESGGKSPPEFTSTHPSHETRVHDLQGWMPAAMQLYQPQAEKNL